MGPVDIYVPGNGAITVLVILLFLGGWKVLDIILWLSNHIYFL